MKREEFLEYRNEICQIFKEVEAKGKFNTEALAIVPVIASALNEFLASRGHQSRITLHPLAVYLEVDDKI